MSSEIIQSDQSINLSLTLTFFEDDLLHFKNFKDSNSYEEIDLLFTPKGEIIFFCLSMGSVYQALTFQSDPVNFPAENKIFKIKRKLIAPFIAYYLNLKAQYMNIYCSADLSNKSFYIYYKDAFAQNQKIEFITDLKFRSYDPESTEADEKESKQIQLVDIMPVIPLGVKIHLFEIDHLFQAINFLLKSKESNSNKHVCFDLKIEKSDLQLFFKIKLDKSDLQTRFLLKRGEKIENEYEYSFQSAYSEDEYIDLKFKGPLTVEFGEDKPLRIISSNPFRAQYIFIITPIVIDDDDLEDFDEEDD